MDSRQRFVLSSLSRQLHKYVQLLENLFGPRDKRFTIGSIERSTHPKGHPQAHFPGGYHENGGCIVNVHVSCGAYDTCSLIQGTWQVAHECVHLLDPCQKGCALILEEGLATWFQDEQKFHSENVQNYIRQNVCIEKNYDEAMRLVVQCMPDLQYAIKKIRAAGTRIEDIVPDQLVEFLPHCEEATIHRLCKIFC